MQISEAKKAVHTGPGTVNSAGNGPGGKVRAENSPEGQNPWPGCQWSQMETVFIQSSLRSWEEISNGPSYKE